MKSPTRLVPLSALAATLALAALALLAGPAAGPAAAAPARAATAEAADGYFQAQDWPKAVDAYAALVQSDSTDGRAWFRLGYAQQMQGRYEDAARAYERSEAISHNPIIMVNLAGVLGHLDRRNDAFRWLMKAADAGYTAAAQLKTDPDLESLRGDLRFAVVLAKVEQNATPCATRPESRQLDFWVGDWDVFTAQGQPAGTSRIEKVVGECVLLENWEGTLGGSGKSMNFYDPVPGQWRQVWVAQNGLVSEFKGALVDGAMQYEGYREQPDHSRLGARITLTPVGPDEVRQVGHNSTDGGKTWTVAYDLTYKRKKPEPPARR